MSKRGPPLSENSRAAWRLLRDAGGYWTAGEIGQRLCPDLDKSTAAIKAARWLVSLENNDHVRARLVARRRAYGVTTVCLPISGETLEPQPLAEEGEPQ